MCSRNKIEIHLATFMFPVSNDFGWCMYVSMKYEFVNENMKIKLGLHIFLFIILVDEYILKIYPE